MQLPKKQFFQVIISAIIVGLIADFISFSDIHDDMFGFSLIFPSSIFITIKIIEIITAKNLLLVTKIFTIAISSLALITFLTVGAELILVILLPFFVFVFWRIFKRDSISDLQIMRILLSLIFPFVTTVAMVFTFALFDYREGPGSPSDMYGLIYAIGLFPALIIGLIYGRYVANNMKMDK